MNRLIDTRFLRAGVHTAAALGGLALFAGCASEPESHVVSAPPPSVAVAPVATTTAVAPVATVPAQVVVTQTPGPNGTIVLNQALPVAPQVVVARPDRPSHDHVWVEGHWTFRDTHYEWINGHWEVPPERGDVWVQPHTEQRSDGNYNFVEGHWSAD
jgi:WXXGXW repeat (2 copies)